MWNEGEKGWEKSITGELLSLFVRPDMEWAPRISIIGIHAKDNGRRKETIDYYDKGTQW